MERFVLVCPFFDGFCIGGQHLEMTKGSACPINATNENRNDFGFSSGFRTFTFDGLVVNSTAKRGEGVRALV